MASACSTDAPHGMAPLPVVAPPSTVLGGAGAPAPVEMPPAAPAIAGSTAAATAGSAAGAGGAAGTAGHSGHDMTEAEHQCALHAEPDPRDATLTSEPMMVTAGSGQDLLLPQIVLDWMDEHEFAEAHDGWHLVRKWDQTCRRSNATASSCTAARRFADQGLPRAPIQQGAPGDGVAFMMMHRHMIDMLKTAFPRNASLFAGFTKVPRTRSDPENPHPWANISWTSSNEVGFDILENIEQNLDRFPTEDDLGLYIENTYRWTEQSPMEPTGERGSGLHGALHAQWAVSGSPANLIDQAVDVKNYTFWKLHGWIDDVWERYRVAKGMTKEDPEYKQLLHEQCMEMYMLQPSNRGSTNPDATGGGGNGGTVSETGVFAVMVRPFLDSTCGGCHSAIAPSAGMTLGGRGVSSSEIIDGLVGVKSTNGEYDLIEPGNPARSWVYLKASGEAASVSCSSACGREKMPPSGPGLTASQLAALRQWIADGATKM
jgi:hypothetical protein